MSAHAERKLQKENTLQKETGVESDRAQVKYRPSLGVSMAPCKDRPLLVLHFLEEKCLCQFFDTTCFNRKGHIDIFGCKKADSRDHGA